MATADDESNYTDDEKTNSDIEKYGLTVIIIEGTEYLPSFAYSVGLWKNFRHPELISFGLTTKTLHEIINLAADKVKAGEPLQIGVTYRDFFTDGRSEFVSVDKRNIRDYFGYAMDFYNSTDFSALQLVWPDRHNRLPWENGFEEEFKFKQPLLDRNYDFKFLEEKNVAVFTTRQLLELDKPILTVIHEHEGDWQFLTGDQTLEDFKMVALEEVVLRDRTLNDVFDLDYGEAADRDSIGGRWTRSTVAKEDFE